MPQPCVICGSDVPAIRSGASYQPDFQCHVCGTFRLSEYAAQRIYEVVYAGNPAAPQLIPNHHELSAVIRNEFERSHRQEVFVESLDQLLGAAHALDNPFEAVDNILLYIARRAERAGAYVELDSRVDYPIGFARDGEEFEYFVRLADQLGFIEIEESMGDPIMRARFLPRAWERLQQLRPHEPDLRRAFVAMGFGTEMTPIFEEGFFPALRDAGFEVVLVNRIPHNDKIDDRIITEIRRSGLVVADFTGQRQNVYFEAGFALGLARHLICTCQTGSEAELHFDIRQYNHVVWDSAADLREKLRYRVEATIPGQASRAALGQARII